MNITKLDRWSFELQEFDISLEFIRGKLNTVADVISHLKNGGLYVEHSKEDQKFSTVTNLVERIEVLDIASKPLNFEREYFPWTQSLVVRNFCYAKKETDSVGN